MEHSTGSEALKKSVEGLTQLTEFLLHRVLTKGRDSRDRVNRHARKLRFIATKTRLKGWSFVALVLFCCCRTTSLDRRLIMTTKVFVIFRMLLTVRYLWFALSESNLLNFLAKNELDCFLSAEFASTD